MPMWDIVTHYQEFLKEDPILLFQNFYGCDTIIMFNHCTEEQYGLDKQGISSNRKKFTCIYPKVFSNLYTF